MTALLDTSKVIVGATGSGKTVTAKDDVQQLLEQRRHVVVIDPTGVWWGMRSTAAGDGAGFDLPIFGGEHGDVPILPDQGAAIARIVLQQRVSAIVDLKSIDNSRDWRRFMHEFVAELRRGVKGNFHLVVDEADEFAAERPADDIGFTLRENLIWIAKRGRAQGFVPTWITQRTAEIAKAVISQAQTIVAHQLIAPSDLKAIDDYLKGHGSAETRKAVMSSLPELAIGERWIYSPRLRILNRGFTPPLTTFDSSRTPGPGEQLVEPRTLAELDVTAIRAALAPPATSDEPESQKAGKPEIGTAASIDPALQQRVALLEDELRTTREERDQLAGAIETFNDRLSGVWTVWKTPIGAIMDAQNDLYGSIVHAGLRPPAERATLDKSIFELSEPGYETRRSAPKLHSHDADSYEATAAAPIAAAIPQVGKPPAGKAPAGIRPPPSSATDVAARGRKALLALASVRPVALSEAQWATLAGYAKTGGTWGTYKSALRAAGLIEQRADGRWIATKAGAIAAGVPADVMPRPGAARAQFWGARVPGARRMVEILAKRWPHFTTRDGLAADLGMAASGGTFGTYLGRLRANDLLEESGKRLRLHTDVMGEV